MSFVHVNGVAVDFDETYKLREPFNYYNGNDEPIEDVKATNQEDRIKEELKPTAELRSMIQKDDSLLRFEEVACKMLSENYAWQYVSEISTYYGSDKDMILKLMKCRCPAYSKLSDELKNDEPFMLEMISKYPDAYIYIPNDMKTNEITNLALYYNGYNLEYAPDKFKQDGDLFMKCAMKTQYRFDWIPDSKQEDVEYIIRLINHSGLRWYTRSEFAHTNWEISIVVYEKMLEKYNENDSESYISEVINLMSDDIRQKIKRMENN